MAADDDRVAGMNLNSRGFDFVAAEEAFSSAMRGSQSKWPSRAKPDRLDPICLPKIAPQFKLKRGESVFTVGSCFARNIEKSLRTNGFRVPALEFKAPTDELWSGTQMVAGLLNKYTPFSMLNELRAILSGSNGSEFLIEADGDFWWDGQLHSDVAVSRERALERRAQVQELFRASLKSSRLVIVTLGLAECWWDDVEKVYLNETLIRPIMLKHPGRFKFRVSPPEDIIEAVLELMSLMRQIGGEQRAIVTVSPVPMQRSFSGQDAITANTYSKAVLRTAAEVATRGCDWVEYFPSFESVTHTARDLAWEDDLIHVRNSLVGEIVGHMVAHYVDNAG